MRRWPKSKIACGFYSAFDGCNRFPVEITFSSRRAGGHGSHVAVVADGVDPALGFAERGKKRSTGSGEGAMYDAVRLTIRGRECTMDVIEVPDSVPVLIGQLPLEHLDFVVDPRSRTLIGNPAHGGEHVYELL